MKTKLKNIKQKTFTQHLHGRRRALIGQAAAQPRPEKSPQRKPPPGEDAHQEHHLRHRYDVTIERGQEERADVPLQFKW